MWIHLTNRTDLTNEMDWVGRKMKRVRVRRKERMRRVCQAWWPKREARGASWWGRPWVERRRFSSKMVLNCPIVRLSDCFIVKLLNCLIVVLVGW